MFTKQNYKAIAGIVEKHSMTAYQVIHRQNFVNELVDYFAKDNPLFDKAKFLLACGMIE
jgi:hypothetical protein